MNRIARILMAVILACAPFASTAASGAEPATTVTGIPLDAPWKVTVYAFARATFHHPAWGWQHSERDYQLSLAVAHGDNLKVDTDVLFAAAMLHDMAGVPPYERKGVEHGDVAAETAEPILRNAGFPMQKYAAVQAAMRGHMFYSSAGTVPEAIALHDADSLDFLGVVGAARMIALTGEQKADIQPAIKALRGFARDIPPRLITNTAKRMGAQRAAELTAFLDSLQTESFGNTI
jgi:uncharacterized protein